MKVSKQAKRVLLKELRRARTKWAEYEDQKTHLITLSKMRYKENSHLLEGAILELDEITNFWYGQIVYIDQQMKERGLYD